MEVKEESAYSHWPEHGPIKTEPEELIEEEEKLHDHVIASHDIKNIKQELLSLWSRAAETEEFEFGEEVKVPQLQLQARAGIITRSIVRSMNAANTTRSNSNYNRAANISRKNSKSSRFASLTPNNSRSNSAANKTPKNSRHSRAPSSADHITLKNSGLSKTGNLTRYILIQKEKTYGIAKDKIHKCSFCTEAFQIKYHLTRHLRIHIRNPFRCDFCRRRLRTKSGFERHIRQHKFFTCHHCGRCKPRKKEIEHHIRGFHNHESFCNKCRNFFVNLKELKKHNSTHELDLKCAHCSYACNQRKRLFRHMLNHFPRDRAQCPICNRSRTTKDSLRRHLLDVHGLEGEDYTCDVCQKHFKSHQMVERHMENHFRRFKCEVCFRWFGKRSSLNHHIRVAHTAGPRFSQYICNECSTLCSSKCILKRHWFNYHNPTHTFQCKTCSYCFRAADGLAGHLKNAKCKVKVRKYPCEKCRFVFSRSEHLKKHKERNNCVKVLLYSV